MRVFLFLLLPILLVGVGVVWPLFDSSKARSEQERAVSFRMTIFSWLIGLVLLGALVLMPNKARVLMLVPVFCSAVFVGQLWKRARLRARRGAEPRVIKRVN